MFRISCLVLLGLSLALSSAQDPSERFGENKVKEIPCFAYKEVPEAELAFVKQHGVGWWHYLKGNTAHARISSLVLTGKPPTPESAKTACPRISRHAGGFQLTGYQATADFKCDGDIAGKRSCIPDPESKGTNVDWAVERGTTEATIVWTHAEKYVIAFRCSKSGQGETTVWSFRSTEDKDPDDATKALALAFIKESGFSVDCQVTYERSACPPAGPPPAAAQAGRSLSAPAEAQGGGYAGHEAPAAQAGRSLSAPAEAQGGGYAGHEAPAAQAGRGLSGDANPAEAFDEHKVKEVECFDYKEVPEAELAFIKKHGAGWWHYVLGNRAHARTQSLVLTGKKPSHDDIKGACSRISRGPSGFTLTGYKAQADYKCEEVAGKRTCLPDPDSKVTNMEWAAERGTTEATIVWTHGEKYALGLRCSKSGAGLTTVWSLRSIEDKDPDDDVKKLALDFIKEKGFSHGHHVTIKYIPFTVQKCQENR